MGGVTPTRLRWGACAWLLTLQFFVVETLAQSRFESPYSRTDDVVSVLGSAESAARQLMNASFVVQGALILAGALLLRPALQHGAAQVAPGLPRGVDAVFERALAKDPGARPASAGELVEELGDVFRDAEPVTAVLPPSPPTAEPPAQRGRLRWLAPLAFVVLLLGGLTAAAFVSNGDEPEVRTITRVTTTVSTVSDTESTLTVTETATVPTR